MSRNLFDGSDESDNDLRLGTNKDYAKSYNAFRKKELLKKFKDRGHNDVDVSESDSSSDSDSSEENEAVDPKFDQAFFKTLASLKTKDPTIYDKNTRFFEPALSENDSEADGDIDGVDGKASKKGTESAPKPKPISIKDYERKILVETGGKFDEDASDAEERNAKQLFRAPSPTLVEEERRLKAEFRKVMNTDEDSEGEFGGVFTKRRKTKEETNEEEEDFAKWLAGKKETIREGVREKLEPLKNYWSNEKLPASERFLRDYILNKGYTATNVADIPTYEEIVGDNAPLSEDEEELEKQAEFEQKFNFRFEEPDSEFIKRFPRTIEASVRLTDDKRKQKRQELKQRKEQEKVQKMKELEIVKEMKRKEIEEKIRQLKKVTGNEQLGFRDDELEDEFDPDAHDRRMKEIFNDEYYQVDEGEEKPDCPSDIDELKVENWDNYDPADDTYNDSYEPHCEDDDFNMDCEYNASAAKEQLQKELIENTQGRKNRKGRRNKFKEMIKAVKPVFNDQDEKTYAEYIDEYYKMDCEDIIGDIPCRFKYVETTPNDFGLTIEEILLAKNKELNQWASLKKAIQIRPEHVEKKDQRLYKMKAKNEELKRKIFKSLYGEDDDDDADEAVNVNLQQPVSNSNEAEVSVERSRKNKRKRNIETTPLTVDSTTSEQKEQPNASIGAPAIKPQIKETIADHEASSNKTLVKGATHDYETAETPQLTNNQSIKTKKPNPFGAPVSTAHQRPGTGDFSGKQRKLARNVGAQKQMQNKHSNQSRRKPQTSAKGDFHGYNKGKPSNSENAFNERLKSYGINPRKFHKKQKYGNDGTRKT